MSVRERLPAPGITPVPVVAMERTSDPRPIVRPVILAQHRENPRGGLLDELGSLESVRLFILLRGPKGAMGNFRAGGMGRSELPCEL